jgi:hypothetical protein
MKMKGLLPFPHQKFMSTKVRAGDGKHLTSLLMVWTGFKGFHVPYKGTFHVAQRSAGELNALPGGGDAVDWAAAGSERVDWC